MSGAGSFFLGLFGLGASAGISAGQSISQKKAVHEAVEEMGYVGTPDVLRMRERVRDVLFCRLWSCPGGFRFFLWHNGIKLFVGLLFLFARGLNTIQNLLQFLLSFFFRQRGRVNVLLLLILPLCLSQLQIETIEWPALLFITHVDLRLLF